MSVKDIVKGRQGGVGPTKSPRRPEPEPHARAPEPGPVPRTVLAADPYVEGVLDEEVHADLVARVDGLAARAGIRREEVWTALAGRVGPQEEAWLRDYPENARRGVLGLLYLGNWSDADARMAALAGAFVRNFVDARLMGARDVVEEAKEGGPRCSVLLVPNACDPGLAEWHTSVVADVLLGRLSRGQQTVLAAPGRGALVGPYGNLGRRVLDSFEVVKR